MRIHRTSTLVGSIAPSASVYGTQAPNKSTHSPRLTMVRRRTLLLHQRRGARASSGVYPAAGRLTPVGSRTASCVSYSCVWSYAWRFFSARVATKPTTQHRRMYMLITYGLLDGNGDLKPAPRMSNLPAHSPVAT